MNRLQRCFDDDAAAEAFAGHLFQGMRHDPSALLVDLAARDFSPTLERLRGRDEPLQCSGSPSHGGHRSSGHVSLTPALVAGV
jgi:hypothetical protein